MLKAVEMEYFILLSLFLLLNVLSSEFFLNNFLIFCASHTYTISCCSDILLDWNLTHKKLIVSVFSFCCCARLLFNSERKRFHGVSLFIRTIHTQCHTHSHKISKYNFFITCWKDIRIKFAQVNEFAVYFYMPMPMPIYVYVNIMY